MHFRCLLLSIFRTTDFAITLSKDCNRSVSREMLSRPSEPTFVYCENDVTPPLLNERQKWETLKVFSIDSTLFYNTCSHACASMTRTTYRNRRLTNKKITLLLTQVSGYSSPSEIWSPARIHARAELKRLLRQDCACNAPRQPIDATPSCPSCKFSRPSIDHLP